jgi:hypothetical protein
MKYDYDNTCLLSVYGSPVWDICHGTKHTEERGYKLLSFKHVIVVCASKEDPTYHIPSAPVGMKPGSAYLVCSVGGYGKGTFKPIAWMLEDVVLLDTPFPLGVGEKPNQGPTPLNCTKPGHVKLLALLNGQVGSSFSRGSILPQSSTYKIIYVVLVHTVSSTYSQVV